MIRNTYLVPACSSWHRIPKPCTRFLNLVISWVLGVLGASFVLIYGLWSQFLTKEFLRSLASLEWWVTLYANENDRVLQLQDGNGHQKDPGLIRRLEFSAPSPTSGRGEGLKIELNTSGQRFNPSYPYKGILRWHKGEESICQYRGCKRREFDPWIGKILWRRKWQPSPVFLPGKFHGQRSLVGSSPRGCKESDTTEWLILSFFWVYLLDMNP